GSVIYTPAGIPHSPRFPPDAFAMILERKRRPGEVDRFQWYCPKCDAFLHEVQFTLDVYARDPEYHAYKDVIDNSKTRPSRKSWDVMPNELAEAEKGRQD